MSSAPREDAQKFWDAFASGRQAQDDAQLAGLALYGASGLYDAYRDRAERISVSELLPKPGSNWRVLDLGCGPGRWTVPFARTCREVVAVDFSSAMLEHARRRCQAAGVAGKVEFVQRGLEDIDPAALGACDLVLVMGVLQFVPEERLPAVVASIVKCVAPGGLLVHRETRTRMNWQKEYRGPDETITMRSYYKTFEHYRAAFEAAGLRLRSRRSILPPSLLYSLYQRLNGAPDGIVLRGIIGLHESLIDPCWRLFPGLLWQINSRRPTDQVAVLYQRSAT